MKCGLCGRDNLSEKELQIHVRFFHKPNDTSAKELCPDCGSGLILQEGCRHCHSCGYSKCG